MLSRDARHFEPGEQSLDSDTETNSQQKDRIPFPTYIYCDTPSGDPILSLSWGTVSMRLLALALAICALAACGDTTPDEAPAETTPAPEQQPPPCEVEQLEDGSVKIQCGDGDPVVLEAGEPGMDGEDGADGQDGSSCEVVETGSDYRVIACEDGTSITLGNGAQGERGEDGEDGESAKVTLVHVEREPAGMNCPDGGVKIETGIDEDGDGALSQVERANATAHYVCDARPDNVPRQITADQAHTCALFDEGIKCWGDPSYGQLGNGQALNTNGISWPVSAIDLPAIPDYVSAGMSHTCALVSTGEVYCWGDNAVGSLGIATQGNTTAKPTSPVPLSERVDQIASGGRLTCALDVTGRFWCWGDVGPTSHLASPERPREVELPFVPVTFDTNAGHTCAVSPGGEVWCWGYNGRGQLGHGDVEEDPTPNQPTQLPAPAIDVKTGLGYTCALLMTGEVYCWGDNAFGQFGEAVEQPLTTPQLLSTGVAARATHLSAGQWHTCVGFDDLTVKCWGEDFDALQTVFPEGIEQLVSGQMHMCVLDGAGDVWCAGNNGNRQCGQHGTSRVTDPRRVLGF